jgi:aspartate aminotransferase
MQFSDRINRVKPSQTLAMATRATQLKAQGKDILSFGIGEPDFDTPHHIKQAAIAAIQQGFTKYTAVEGILELREAIATKFARDNHLQYEPNQVIVSSGGKQSFYNLAQSLLNTGDEVIIPAPYWVSFPDMVLLANGEPVFLRTELNNNFKITAAQLEAAITPNTRLFILNSPSNPTGIAYTRSELKALADVLLKYPRILIATDDMYEYIYWGSEPFCTLLNACPELYDRTIILHGLSKTYAMTGWRIGFAAGPQPIIQAMATIQGQSTSGPCSVSQRAALAALEGDQTCVHTMVRAFKERHDFVVDALNRIPGIECLPGDGTFYVFPNVEGVLSRCSDITKDWELADHLLTEAGIVITPGTAFGCSGHFRLSFATSLENLQEGIKRLGKALRG